MEEDVRHIKETQKKGRGVGKKFIVKDETARTKGENETKTEKLQIHLELKQK